MSARRSLRQKERACQARAADSLRIQNSQLAVMDEELSDSEGEDCEFHVYESRYDANGEKRSLRVGTKTEIGLERDKSHRAAFVLIRDYDESKDLASTQLRIRSRYVKKALQEVIGTYPGTYLNTSGPIFAEEPIMFLFHYRSEIEAYARSTSSEKTRLHLDLCLGYMKKALKTAITRYDTTMQPRIAEPGLEHQDLWMAYKPGALIYEYVNEVETLSSLRFMWSKLDSDDASSDHWTLALERIQYNGKNFGFVGHRVKIDTYDGCRPLRSLKAFPLSFHLEEQRIRRELKERGKKYLALTGIQHQSYNGMAKICANYSPSDKENDLQPRYVEQRVMIDCEEFRRNVEITDLDYIGGTKTIDTTSNNHLKLSDAEILICGHEVPGYLLLWKRWAIFNVSNIEDVNYNSDAFHNLVLCEEKKDLIHCLVRQYDGPGSTLDDFIKGKGKGLIFLLHGPPGVGKTFTAESVADHTHRPLMSISSGHITGPAPWVEKKLIDLLSLATRWKAIALIDEADVFMQERNLKDLERNGLVSCFLRVLEYFEGTLFLTTNRVAIIDPAFHSRVQLSVAFPNLSPEALRDLWRTWILRACSKRRVPWLTNKFLERLVSSGVNGREIKNIISIAHALARNGRREMKAADLLRGLEAMKAFDSEFHGGKIRQSQSRASDEIALSETKET